jgi:pyridoxine kinase
VRDELVPLADVLTPNQYELELLTGVADSGLALARLCGDSRIAVVTSAEDARIPADRVGLLLYGGDRVRLATTPRLGVPTHGAGDLTAALFAGQLTRGLDPEAALSATVRAVTRVLRTPRQDPWELPLVAARHELTATSGTIGSGEDELRWEA